MNILVVFTGGTIACSENDGVLSPDLKNSALLIKMYNKIDKNTDFTIVQPYNILSENLSEINLVSLYKCISSHDLKQYDGVIVAHGTDTLQYTSSFLSYAFGLCEVPIVVVSANYPLNDERSNGLANFVSAMDFIKSGEARGVFVAYKNFGKNPEIHRASRVLPHSSYSDCVYSVSGECYGEIVDGDFIKNQLYIEFEDEVNFSACVGNIEKSKVLKISPYVGIVYPELNRSVKAILLESYHSGTLNTEDENLKEFCKIAFNLNIPVFLTGACSGFSYESKLAYDELKIRVLPVASPVAMYIKLWLCDSTNINRLFLNCGGDFLKDI